ncbi:Metallo-hydrolase/oxidoreductase, partial [Schizopora paradoxa]
MSKISSMVANIPIEWAKELTGHAQRPVKVVKPYFVDGGAGLLSSSRSDRSIKAIWLGHASFLVELPSKQRLLFDPIFSDRAGPSAWTGIRRRLPPPCTVEDLPAVHIVLISHNHYDHLDLPSIQSIFKIRGKDVTFVVPQGLASWLVSSGIPSEQITELDWWDEKVLPHPNHPQDEDKSITITCTPAQHTSGRSVMDRNTTLWCSWAIRQKSKGEDGKTLSANIFHAGDTGYMTPRGPCPVFKEIGERLGPFDLAMIPIWRGGTLGFISQLGLRLTHHPALSALHCTPVEAVRGIRPDIRARHSLACHFATFAGSDAEALEPLVELEWAKRTGDWMEEGGFGWIDVGATAEITLN